MKRGFSLSLRVWIKKFDTVSEWMEHYLLSEVKAMERRGESMVRKVEREETPL